MKNIKVTIAVLLALTAFNASAIITSPSSNSLDAAGTVIKYDKAFIQVKNVSGISQARGTVMFAEYSTHDNGVMASTGTTKYETPLCVLEEALDSNEIGRCQVWGYHDGLLVSVRGQLDGATGTNAGAATAGQALFASVNDAGYAVGAMGRAASHAPIGYALDSSATSGAVEAMIKLL